MEETRVLRENHRPIASHWQTLSYNVVSSTPHLSRIQSHNVSYKCNYHTITMSPTLNVTAAYFIVYNHWLLCQKHPWFKRLTVIGLDSNTLWLSTCLFSMRIKWKHGQQIVWHFNFRTRNCFFMPQRRRVGWYINLPPVRPSGYRYMLCPLSPPPFLELQL